MGIIGPPKNFIKKNIQSGFWDSRIWPLNPQAISPEKIGPSESFRFQEEDIQAREEIFERCIPKNVEDVVHYYGSGDDLEEDQLHEEELEQDESPTAVNSRKNSISKFLKLLRGSRRARIVRKAEPLVDYSQRQLLISSQHMSNL